MAKFILHQTSVVETQTRCMDCWRHWIQSIESHFRRFLFSMISASVCMLLAANLEVAANPPVRVGIVGLDTSHAPNFARLINQNTAADQDDNDARNEITQDEIVWKVVCAYPGGSSDLAASRDRISGFTEEIRQFGIEIVDSIEDLLPKVDAVLLESVDGRKHLEQVIPIFQAGKPVFIDKPLAADLTEAIAIDLIAKKLNGRWFSSSSLRFSPSIQRFRENSSQEKIVGAAAWSPCALEPTHVDLFWYGIHGVETLYTAMGVGCESVQQTSSDGTDFVVGLWKDGRIGTFRGIRDGASGYGLVVFGKDKIDKDAKYEGYGPLIDKICEFFLGAPHPVDNLETLEIMTFMQAAYKSKQLDGKRVRLKDVWEQHLADAEILANQVLIEH